MVLTSFTVSPFWRSLRSLRLLESLIQLEFLLPIGIIFQWLLIVLVQKTIFQHQNINSGPHKTAIGVFRRAHDRLAPNVEGCVDDETAAGLGLKGFQQLVVAGIRVLV